MLNKVMTFEQILNDKYIFDDIKGKVEGVYFVYLPENIEFILNNTTSAIEKYKGKKLVYDTPEEIAHIKERWKIIQSANEEDNRLLYIGQSVDLKKRLKCFAKYGCKRAKNHRGGKIIWQLSNAMKCHISYYACSNSLQREHELISDFKKRHFGERPLANEKD